MEGNKTTLLDIENPDNNRDFYFDHSFWSHDGYKVQPNGIVTIYILFFIKLQKYVD